MRYIMYISSKEDNLKITKNIMKTNKILTAWLAASAIILITMSSVSAMNGQWQWQGQGFGKTLTTEQRTELQSMSESDRQEYVNKLKSENGFEKWSNSNWSKENHNPGDMIVNIPASDLSDKEEEILYYGYSEEMLARDVYNYLYELYNEDVFKKIADSEQKHMDAVEVLFDRYELQLPTGYGDLQSTFDALKSEGEQGLKEALEVGLKIEILDIEDIDDAILNTDNDDFKIVFTNIGWASYNHMKEFVNALENNNLTTDIDYSDYLTQELVDTKWTLKYLLAEKLESEWVDIPEQVSSEDMKANCDNEEQEKWYEGNKWKWKSESSQRNNEQANFNKYANNSVLKAKYKSTYEVKYGSLISKMDDSSLESFISKVDWLLEKIEAWNYSDETKIKYNSMLLALKEIAVDNIDEDTILDELFN